LIDHFPFVNFKDAKVITLFENIGLSLGCKDEIKVLVVNKFRSFLKFRFKKIVKDIHAKHAS
jgi:hypothetical protein